MMPKARMNSRFRRVMTFLCSAKTTVAGGKGSAGTKLDGSLPTFVRQGMTYTLLLKWMTLLGQKAVPRLAASCHPVGVGNKLFGASWVDYDMLECIGLILNGVHFMQDCA